MNNLKRSAILTMFLCVSGCGNWITEGSINKAIELCEGNGGIRHLSIFTADNVVCRNGATFSRSQWFVDSK